MYLLKDVCVREITFAGRKMCLAQKEPDGPVLVFCPCEVLNCDIKVPMTREQAEVIFCRERKERGYIRDILHNLPPQVQEIFISGTTPAEWDVGVMGTKPKPKEHYAKLGYIFEDCEQHQ